MKLKEIVKRFTLKEISAETAVMMAEEIDPNRRFGLNMIEIDMGLIPYNGNIERLDWISNKRLSERKSALCYRFPNEYVIATNDPKDFITYEDIFQNWFKVPQNAMLQELASIQHDIWSHWMEYFFSKCTEQEIFDNGKHFKTGNLVINKDLVKRWKRQMKTPYNELSETEKQSDIN